MIAGGYLQVAQIQIYIVVSRPTAYMAFQAFDVLGMKVGPSERGRWSTITEIQSGGLI